MVPLAIELESDELRVHGITITVDNVEALLEVVKAAFLQRQLQGTSVLTF